MSGKTRTLTQFYQPNFRSGGSGKTAKKKAGEKVGEGGGCGGGIGEGGRVKESPGSLCK